MSITGRSWTTSRTRRPAKPEAASRPENRYLSEFNLVNGTNSGEWEPEVLEAAAQIIVARSPPDARACLRPGVRIGDWNTFLQSVQRGLRAGPNSNRAVHVRRDIADTLFLLNDSVTHRGLMV